MGGILNVGAYRSLLEGDLEWLLSMPKTLERQHIESLIRREIAEAPEVIEREIEKLKTGKRTPIVEGSPILRMPVNLQGLSGALYLYQFDNSWSKSALEELAAQMPKTVRINRRKHGQRAQINHQQSLETLIKRGGLSPVELIAMGKDIKGSSDEFDEIFEMSPREIVEELDKLYPDKEG